MLEKLKLWWWSQCRASRFILGGFTAFKALELFKNQQNHVCTYNYSYITDLFITFGSSRCNGMLIAAKSVALKTALN